MYKAQKKGFQSQEHFAFPRERTMASAAALLAIMQSVASSHASTAV
jgi:hypothetical protein